MHVIHSIISRSFFVFALVLLPLLVPLQVGLPHALVEAADEEPSVAPDHDEDGRERRHQHHVNVHPDPKAALHAVYLTRAEKEKGDGISLNLLCIFTYFITMYSGRESKNMLKVFPLS